MGGIHGGSYVSFPHCPRRRTAARRHCFRPFAGIAATSQAVADSDDLYCWIIILPNGEEDIECDTVGRMKVICKLADPDSNTEECQDIGRMFVPPLGLTADTGNSGGDGTSGPRTPAGLGLAARIDPAN